MATLTILQKPELRKVRIEINLDQWERLADALGFYSQPFLDTVNQSLKESKEGRVRKIRTLDELKD